MALPNPPLNPNYPIPNNPFYAPEANYIQGEFGPFIIGSGLYLDILTGVLSASGSGGPGVSSITASTGIYVSQATGNITIANTGVVNITPGSGIGVTKVGGNYTITNTAPAINGGGTVTSITAGTGLSGGTISTSGTISLATSGAGPGTYTNPTITVDAYGRITFISPGFGGGGGGPVLATLPLRSNGLTPSTISIDAASTFASGAVRLNDTLTSDSTTEAATPRTVKQAYTTATAAQASSTTALTAAQSACTAATNAVNLAANAQAQATQALTRTATAQSDATQALVDAAAAQSTANTALSTANAANTTANTALLVANGAIPRSSFSVPGQLLVGKGSGTFSALNPGANGFVLTACSGSPSGLVWCPAGSTGTVTCVMAGTGLCGGPIVSTGTLCLTDTGVFPARYNNASLTVDAQGRITSISANPQPITVLSGTSPICITGGATPVISVAQASISSTGVVQLYNNTNSGSVALALTAAQGKKLQDQINALSPTSNLTFAGTFDASTSQMVTVTAQGSTAGFLVNANVPSPSAGNADYFVLVTVGGSYSPPPSGPSYNTSQGDWLLSNGTSWQFLDVGPSAPYATTTDAGLICLATNLSALAGTNGITAITPSIGRATYVFKCDYPAKGSIVAGTGACTIGALAAGTNDYVLTACSLCPTGLTWTAPGAASIPCTCISGKGAILTGTGSALPISLPLGSDGRILTVDNTTSTGLAWAVNTAIPCSIINGKGALVTGTASNAPTALPPGLDDYVLTADSNCAAGLKWSMPTPSGVTCVCTGTGLTGGPIGSTGTICLEDTLVSPGAYTLANITVDQQGRLTSAANGVAVTCVCAGTGLTGGPITSTGTLCLADTAVSPGLYTYATINVDQQGRILSALSGVAPSTSVTAPITNVGTAIAPSIGIDTATTGQLGAVQIGSNIDVASGVISVATSSTTNLGVVQLNNTVTSNSITEALTAAQGQNLQDQINALSAATNLTLAGTFNASNGKMVTVTAAGGLVGFTLNNNLPAAAVTLTDYFVIVTTSGNYNPPGGGGPYDASQGDWFLCDGTSWSFLNVGSDLPVASTGTQGIVQLATPTQTVDGTSATLAVTPAGAAAAYVPIKQLTAKGALITATGADTPSTLAPGANNQVLVACSSCPSGLTWVTPSLPAQPATPNVRGTVLGCTDASNAALGCDALLAGVGSGDNVAIGRSSSCSLTTGYQNIAVGSQAMRRNATGAQNVAIGSIALDAMVSGLSNDAFGAMAMPEFVSGCYNVAFGGYSLFKYTGGCFNTAVGHRSMTDLTTGQENVALGAYSGQYLTTGCRNVAIGFGTNLPNPAGNCQLAIGYGNGCCWLTGDSGRNIRPGAGIRDCAGSLGTAGQVLCSTGSAVQWATPSKHFMSASIRSQQTLARNQTVSSWQIDNSLGIGYFFSNFTLTAGKNYLVTASLVINDTTYQFYTFQWANNSGTLISPVMLGRPASTGNFAAPYSFSGSFVFSATPSANGLQLRNVAQPCTMAADGNSITIIEI